MKLKATSNPSLDHLNLMLFTWLICTVLTGVVLGIVFANWEEKAMRLNRRAQATSSKLRRKNNDDVE